MALRWKKRRRVPPSTIEAVARWEHFEVWAEKAGKWELIAAFLDFDVASAVARNYTYRMKLVHAVFEDGRRVQEETLAELGATRHKP